MSREVLSYSELESRFTAQTEHAGRLEQQVTKMTVQLQQVAMKHSQLTTNPGLDDHGPGAIVTTGDLQTQFHRVTLALVKFVQLFVKALVTNDDARKHELRSIVTLAFWHDLSCEDYHHPGVHFLEHPTQRKARRRAQWQQLAPSGTAPPALESEHARFLQAVEGHLSTGGWIHDQHLDQDRVRRALETTRLAFDRAALAVFTFHVLALAFEPVPSIITRNAGQKVLDLSIVEPLGMDIDLAENDPAEKQRYENATIEHTITPGLRYGHLVLVKCTVRMRA
jgi:hypothetical protein